MSGSDVTPKEAQVSRLKYLLKTAGNNAGLAGWTAQVIALLAPKLVEAMEDEGYFIESWQAVKDRCAAMEAEAR